MPFRTDINGLRALAVLAVVLYHFDVFGFQGGFIGVDIFFVISGFLMTRIIVEKQMENRFSFTQFMAARAVRILPALAVCCALLLAAGWLYVPPADYQALGKHAFSAVTFSSNFVFKDEDGYFDALSHDKWLLHTWSLSVEFQFYLILPFILALAFRFADRPRRVILATLCALGGISLIASILTSREHSSFAFYLLPARMWEFILGGLVYGFAPVFAPTINKHGKAFFHAGLLLIAAGLAFTDANTVWPGTMALLPVIGTCAIIAANRHHPLFDNLPMQKIGIWSYSIYLWHWPVTVALRYGMRHEDPVWITAGIALSVLAGYVSYRFVETPAREQLKSGNRKPLIRYTALAALTLAAAGGIYVSQGLPLRANADVARIESVIPQNAVRKDNGICQKTRHGFSAACKDMAHPAFILWGDSHAGAVHEAVRGSAAQHLPQKGDGILFTNNCPPLETGYLSSKKKGRACPDSFRSLLAQIEQSPPDTPVIAVFRASYYIRGYNESPKKSVKLYYTDIDLPETQAAREKLFAERFAQTLCKVAQTGRPVYALAPVPEMGIDVPKTMSRQRMLGKALPVIGIDEAAYHKRHDLVRGALHSAAQNCGITVLDPVPYFCADGFCAGVQAENPLYYDDDHLSTFGNAQIRPLFDKVFQPRAD